MTLQHACAWTDNSKDSMQQHPAVQGFHSVPPRGCHTKVIFCMSPSLTVYVAAAVSTRAVAAAVTLLVSPRVAQHTSHWRIAMCKP
jgi:hypothetical protein